MKMGDVLRSWRLEDGGLLVEVVDSYVSAYHHLHDGRLTRSYTRRLGSDAELLYLWGYQVTGGRFEHCTHVEVGYPYRRDLVSVGDPIFDGLEELPAGTITREDLTAAGVP